MSSDMTREVAEVFGQAQDQVGLASLVNSREFQPVREDELTGEREVNGVPDALYNDPSPPLFRGVEEEDLLVFLEYQARMTSGMEMIGELRSFIEQVRESPEYRKYSDFCVRFNRWREERELELEGLEDGVGKWRLLGELKRAWVAFREGLDHLRPEALEGRPLSSYQDRLGQLWDCWFELRDELNGQFDGEILKACWARYFRDGLDWPGRVRRRYEDLVEEPISPYLTWGDTTRVDEQQDLNGSLWDCLRDQHLREKEREDWIVRKPIRVIEEQATGGFIPYVRYLTLYAKMKAGEITPEQYRSAKLADLPWMK